MLANGTSGAHAAALTEILFISAKNPLVRLSLANSILDLNSAFSAATGYSRNDLNGLPFDTLGLSTSDHPAWQKIHEFLRESGDFSGRLGFRHKNGAYAHYQLRIETIFDDAHQAVERIAFFDHPAALNTPFERDRITDLPLLPILLDRVSCAVLRAERSGRAGCLLAINLDNLSAINQHHGFQSGDLALKTLADRLRKAVRKTDSPARLPGNSCAVLLDEVQSLTNASGIAEKILRSNERPFRCGESSLKMQLSIGMTIFPADGNDAETLVLQARDVMNWVKDQGGNRYHAYVSMERRPPSQIPRARA